MLKTLSIKLIEPKKGDVGVYNGNKARRNKSQLNGSKVDIGKVGDNEVGKKVQQTSKSKNLSKSKKTVESYFFTSKARLVFIKLRQTFVKALILYYFDSKHYIRVKMDILGYGIGRILSFLTSDNLC